MRKLLIVLGITLLVVLVAAPVAGAASSAAVAGEWTWVNTGVEARDMPVDHGLLAPKVTKGYLARYAKLVTSADRGAVLKT